MTEEKQKQWVYDSLVRHDKDTVGLIAYGLYKKSKRALACNLRADGKNEDEINLQLKSFHDQTILTDGLESYREQAKAYLDELFSNVADKVVSQFEKETIQIEAGHQDEINRLKNQHKRELIKSTNSLVKKMKEFSLDNKPWYEKLQNWLLSGIPSVVSSVFLTALIVGATMLLVSEDKRKEILGDIVAEYLTLPENSQKN